MATGTIKSLKNQLIDTLALKNEVRDLDLTAREEEFVLLKLSTLIENYLLE